MLLVPARLLLSPSTVILQVPVARCHFTTKVSAKDIETVQPKNADAVNLQFFRKPNLEHRGHGQKARADFNDGFEPRLKQTQRGNQREHICRVRGQGFRWGRKAIEKQRILERFEQF